MWEIYAYQNADSLFGIFNAAATIHGSGDYMAAVAAVAFCGFIAALVAYAFAPEKLQGWKWLATVLLVFSVLIVPRVTVVTRKTYGGAYIAMNARSLGATRVFAWPGAEVAVMGAVAAVRILHRRKLAEVAPDIRGQVETELAEEHARLAGGIDKAIEIGVVDEVVQPGATRTAIARAIADSGLVTRGNHGNIPL